MSTASRVVEFDTDFLPYFTAHYPAISNNPKVDENDLRGFFDSATLLVNNAACAIVPFDATHNDRLLVYCLAVAHLATLGLRGAGIVGQIASGSQGSVSMGANTLQMSGNTAPYWMQTQYGAQYWMATAPYRQFMYVSPLPVNWK